MRYRDLLTRVLLLAFSTLLTLGGVEALVRALDLFPSQIEATQAAEEPAVDQDQPVSRYVLHPFLGWSHRSGPASGTPYNQFGLRSRIPDYRDLKESDFVIGVLGGSVARGLVLAGGSSLAKRLEEERPELEGRIRLVTLASGGYKQPQQLYLLSQMQLLGVPFDAVVNVDGFNEVALGGTDAAAGFHPLFPFRSYWSVTYDLARGVTTPRQIELSAGILAAKRSAQSRRAFLDRHHYLAKLRLLRAVVGFGIQKSARRAIVLEEKLGAIEHVDHTEAVQEFSAPCLSTDEGCWEVIAQIWAKASRQLAVIAESEGSLYLHALQPNQYVEGTKELTPEELAIAWNPDHAWSRSAAAGYPFLIAAGRELERDGVDFHDLTKIFLLEEDTLYRDTCCHYEVSGYNLIAVEIADRLADAMEARASRAES